MAAPLTDDDWEDLLARRQTGNLYGVKTTGIFCLSGCPARTPLRQNVILLTDLAEAQLMGFRPCKRCRPDVRKVKA